MKQMNNKNELCGGIKNSAAKATLSSIHFRKPCNTKDKTYQTANQENIGD